MRDKRAPFLIATSYLAALLFIRLSVIIAGSAESKFAAAAKAGNMPDAYFYIGRNVILFGYHIHHFYFGILFMAIAGWFAIVGSKRVTRTHTAILYGAGLGLFFDEIGLLLTWGDYYSSLSFTLSAILLGVFLNIMFFGPFWRSVRENLVSVERRSPVAQFLMREHRMFGTVEQFVTSRSGSERIQHVLTGTLHITAAVLILWHPKLVFYIVGVDFVVSGAMYMIRPLLREEYER